MSRRHPRPDSGPDHDEAARWAQEGRWWAARAQVDQPLTPVELARYRALYESPPEYAIDAILAASVAPPAVARGLVERWSEA
jgi:hypothetical protein